MRKRATALAEIQVDELRTDESESEVRYQGRKERGINEGRNNKQQQQSSSINYAINLENCRYLLFAGDAE
ncbi:uncharacterized protein H6S33_012934 [Morchella sextelata]|uniref:uncharacterized protein n=1 Tax=Morchella sextelata TaxID=1174677 RepID=UPI001D03C2AD|nr:uncharacterized protein H6S33_012934 [Morchella sextelata]KAH0609448.1 hypothetical protein H6S33_012934 [Morchella sextelata]